MTTTEPLYARVMGASWSQIAEPVRRVHATHSMIRAGGRFRIEHGRHVLARLLAQMLRLPLPNPAAETRLIVTARGDVEHWERTFDGRRFDTRQYESSESDLAERFGVLELRFHLDASSGSLLYVQRQASFLFGSVRLRIPVALAPRVEAREDPAGPTRVRVDVRVVLPGAGLLIACDGTLDVGTPA